MLRLHPCEVLGRLHHSEKGVESYFEHSTAPETSHFIKLKKKKSNYCTEHLLITATHLEQLSLIENNKKS